MYTRLIILIVTVIVAVAGLGGLGFHAIEKWAQGLEGARLGEFAEVAEQVRQDVKRKLDDFVRTEQQRKYTDYLYSYVPENVVDAGQLPLLRSPLGNQFSNEFAYGYFQIEPDGAIITPYYQGTPPPGDSSDPMAQVVQSHISNVGQNVVPSISLGAGAIELPPSEPTAGADGGVPTTTPRVQEDTVPQGGAVRKGTTDTRYRRSQAYPIESLSQEAQQAQVFRQQRSIALSNYAQKAQVPSQESMGTEQEWSAAGPAPQDALLDRYKSLGRRTEVRSLEGQSPPQQVEPPPATPMIQPGPTNSLLSDTVQVRIEPFVPLVVPDPNRTASVFGGQVFLLRHVQIENRHLLQGFQLDERRLVREVEQSAQAFIRDGMGFALPQVQQVNGKADARAIPPAYTAILDFGFGDLLLDLTEIDPAWITKRIGDLRRIYLAIIATVAAAVGLSLLSLWHNVRAQAALVQKKDDFISAVSHELRTPLTSIRMYTEMLQRDWVKSPEKVAEYHRTMHQESERLSRLVENVLDFARLQKGRKQYAFRLGSINECVAGVVEMMRPYAAQYGFTIRTNLAATDETSFDKDAVTQIVVNLLDNAVKYARGAADKTIQVRTRSEPGQTVIEVEDHGPGIPSRLRRKVFEQFYRGGDSPVGAGQVPKRDMSHLVGSPPRACPPAEGQPQGVAPTTGMGLGLTLVRRFAEAHGGFVEILRAQPTGVILRIALATQPDAGA